MASLSARQDRLPRADVACQSEPESGHQLGVVLCKCRVRIPITRPCVLNGFLSFSDSDPIRCLSDVLELVTIIISLQFIHLIFVKIRGKFVELVSLQASQFAVKSLYMRFQVLKVENMKMAVFWVVQSSVKFNDVLELFAACISSLQQPRKHPFLFILVCCFDYFFCLVIYCFYMKLK